MKPIQNIDRRAVLGLLAVGAVVGCTQVTQAVTLAGQVVADVQGISQQLSASFPQFASALSGGVATQVEAWIAKLDTAASALSTTLTVDSARPTVQAALDAVQQVVSLVGPALPAPYGTIVLAADTLLPLIAEAVGLTVAPGAAAPGAMTPAAARVTLGIPVVTR